MLAEISVFPLDKGGEGLSRYVAEAVRAIESSGLDFEVHALGTLIEGPADKVFEVIRQCHELVAAHSNRVVTYVRIDDRKGVHSAIRSKVRSVEEKLGREFEKK